MEYNDELERMKHRQKQRRQQEHIPEKAPAAEKNKAARGSSRAGIRKKRQRQKRLRGILLLCVILIGVIGFLFFKNRKNDGYWTIAVFGLDARDGSLGKGALSDVIMICNIDRKTGEMKLVSVFRDTYLKIDKDNTYHKINQAYHRGGSAQAVAALEENLDLKIDDYVSLNWKAVVDAINILGGVDLEITASEFKYINSFITETVETTGVGSVHLPGPGTHHLDGVQAVAYARLRLMDTDYNRTERQRKVIGLAMEKAKQADFAVLNNILVTVFPQLKTSIGIEDLIPIAQNVKNYSIAETAGFPFARAAVDIGKKDCVVALTLESNVVQLHQFLFGTTDYKASLTVRNISAQIAKDSGMGEVGTNAPTGLPSGGGDKSPTTTAAVISETETTTEETMLTEEVTSIPEETTAESTTAVVTDSEETPAEVGPGANLKPSEPKETTATGEKPTTAETIGPGMEVGPGENNEEPETELEEP